MTDWYYRVPPDLTVLVRAAKRPALLSRILDEADATPEPALVLDLTARAAPGSGVLSIDGAGGRTVRGVYKLVPWSCTIGAEGGRPSIAFQAGVMREYLAFHIALLPALRRLLLERDVALMPGAAFELDGDVTVLAGMTGGGKTSLLMGAIEAGAHLVGDEYIAISATGEVTPVVQALALRRATLGLAPEVASRLSRRRRLALRAAALATTATRGRLEPLSHIAPADLGLPEEAGRGTARRLFWLDPDGAGEMRPIGASDAVQQLATMQAVHDLAYGNIAPFLDTKASGDPEARWRSVIEQALGGVSCYRLPVQREHLDEALEHGMAA